MSNHRIKLIAALSAIAFWVGSTSPAWSLGAEVSSGLASGFA